MYDVVSLIRLQKGSTKIHCTTKKIAEIKRADGKAKRSDTCATDTRSYFANTESRTKWLQ